MSVRTYLSQTRAGWRSQGNASYVPALGIFEGALKRPCPAAAIFSRLRLRILFGEWVGTRAGVWTGAVA